MVRLILFYQRWISPLFPPRCRFYPSCSEYALIAIEQHGGVKGAFLATKRLCRCHPLCEGGYDPVPGCSDDSEQSTEKTQSTASESNWLELPRGNTTGNYKS